jgi:hypothetical protein
MAVVVLALPTVCDTAADVLGPYFVVPVNSAVRLCDPTPSEVTASVATPAAFTCTGPDPSDVVPSLNVTLPVGVLPEAAMVAVSVVDCPNTVGVIDVASAVVVGIGFTVCVVVPEATVCVPSPP